MVFIFFVSSPGDGVFAPMLFLPIDTDVLEGVSPTFLCMYLYLSIDFVSSLLSLSGCCTWSMHPDRSFYGVCLAPDVGCILRGDPDLESYDLCLDDFDIILL